MSPADVAEHIRGALRCDRPGCACRRATGNAHCPGHDDPSPSLSVTAKDGRILWRCFAGCEQGRVRDALSERGLWPPADETVRQNGSASKPPERTWDAVDPDTGAVVSTHVRVDLPPDPDTGKTRKRVFWRPGGVKATEVPLYRWQALAGAEVVVVCEGEPAADAAAAVLAGQPDVAVVGTVCGAAAIPCDRELGRIPAAATVVAWADADAAGREHMRRIADRRIALGAPDVRLLDPFPDSAGGEDAVDVLAGGITAQAAVDLIASAVPYRPAAAPGAAANGRAPLRFVTARQFAKQTPETTDWVVKPWIAAGALTKLDGPPKAAGKTTFLTRLIAAVLDGADFLGEPTKRGPVVLLTEQGGTSFREALAAAGLLDRDDLHMALYRDTVALSWEHVVADTFALARGVGAVLVAVDTLPALARVRGDDENSSGRALAAIEPLQLGADALGVGLALSFHDRKGGGEVGESGRGSSAYAGAVDVVLHLERTGGNFGPSVRRLTALSRFNDTPDELYIELTPSGYASLGDRADVVRMQVAETLAGVLPASEDDALPVAAVKRKGEDGEDEAEPGILDVLAAAGVKAARSTVDDELKRWHAEGYVGRTGGGKRGSPYRYWLTATPPVAFFRSKPSDPSEESNATGQKVSSDARTPSEETNGREWPAGDGDGDEDPFLSSDAPDGYSGRKQCDGAEEHGGQPAGGDLFPPGRYAAL